MPGMTAPRRLVVLRHAKAEPFAARDHARELTARGLREAEAAGRYLAERGLVPDHAVVSSAARTRATWTAMEHALGPGVDVVHDEAVYSGGVDVALEALGAVPETARLVLLVGHQPTVGQLAHLLDDGNGDRDALHAMLHAFPTASLALFDVTVPWTDLSAGTGRLIDFRPGS
jgi:phosphohistidine phosphatase